MRRGFLHVMQSPSLPPIHFSAKQSPWNSFSPLPARASKVLAAKSNLCLRVTAERLREGGAAAAALSTWSKLSGLQQCITHSQPFKQPHTAAKSYSLAVPPFFNGRKKGIWNSRIFSFKEHMYTVLTESYLKQIRCRKLNAYLIFQST